MGIKDDTTIVLHDYEARYLIRLLACHVTGPEDGPRGVLTQVLYKLLNARGESVLDYAGKDFVTAPNNICYLPGEKLHILVGRDYYNG